MIPLSYLREWSATAPWPDLRQVEQDLVISRALCDLFSDPFLATKIAFGGGTAIHKLLFQRPLRYSEDIDLIQSRAEGIGTTIDAIRSALSWLGRCSREQAGHSIHLVLKFAPETDAPAKLKLKVEINTREHESFLGTKEYPFGIENGWHRATAAIRSFEPEELFATKLRALLQRRKGRDLFDINEGLRQLTLDPEKLIACFEHYLALEGTQITRAVAEQRMLAKLNRSLTEDIAPLLPAGVRFTEEDGMVAFGKVWFELITRIQGEPWKLSAAAIEKVRRARMPTFLQK